MNHPSRPDLDPTTIPSPIDIAWAAGFYEGEGSCQGYKKRSLVAHVCQKDPESLYRLRDLFGGSVNEYANPGMSGKGTIFKWVAGGDKARLFLALIYPFLTARRKSQVDKSRALEFMGGELTVGLSRERLLTRLLNYYEEYRKTTLRGMEPEQRKAYWRDNARKLRAKNGVKSNTKLWQKRDALKVVEIAQGKVS
jgi:hypothetical protein